jgi:hypothetical protein
MQSACAVLYCHLWPVWLYHIFPLISFLERKVIEHKMWFSLQLFFFWNISHSNKNSARYCRKCTHVFMYIIRYYYQILMKLELSGQIFEKFSNNEFHETPFSWSRAVPGSNLWSYLCIIVTQLFPQLIKHCVTTIWTLQTALLISVASHLWPVTRTLFT